MAIRRIATRRYRMLIVRGVVRLSRDRGIANIGLEFIFLFVALSRTRLFPRMRMAVRRGKVFA